ncbi:hypothetical protein D7Y24_19390 [Stenotrophomonas maltophilia]|nr:hypothetical protein [Stenotrophomonas maltophilia]HBP02800.1 hypothetical protein [Stenotrophomonas sp.]
MLACFTNATALGFLISAKVSRVVRHWDCAFRASRMYVSVALRWLPMLRAARRLISRNTALRAMA